MQSLQSQPNSLPVSQSYSGPAPQKSIRALVVSAHLESRHGLLKTLEAMGADVILCSNRSQAEDSLSRLAFDIVFSDWHLPDGSYSDLIHSHDCGRKIPRVAVTVTVTERDFQREALAKGAFAVVRWPGCATDIEMTVLRAMREEDCLAARAAVA